MTKRPGATSDNGFIFQKINKNQKKKLFGPHNFFTKNIYSVGCATLSFKNEVML
jgi:hypothetical protein